MILDLRLCSFRDIKIVKTLYNPKAFLLIFSRKASVFIVVSNRPYGKKLSYRHICFLAYFLKSFSEKG